MPKKPQEKKKPVQESLPTGKVHIYADCREAPSQINNYIQDKGALVSCIQLKVGDYICSERVGIERKTVTDFISSVVSGRLFNQLQELKENFDSPILIIEGNNERLFFENGLHPNAIRGALASISVDYKVPIIWTRNSKETAAQVHWIAHREQKKLAKGIAIRGDKRPRDLPGQQEYIISGLPSVNSKLSRRLLEHFGTVKKVMNAKPERLQRIDKIGEKKAKQIHDLLNAKYEKKG